MILKVNWSHILTEDDYDLLHTVNTYFSCSLSHVWYGRWPRKKRNKIKRYQTLVAALKNTHKHWFIISPHVVKQYVVFVYRVFWELTVVLFTFFCRASLQLKNGCSSQHKLGWFTKILSNERKLLHNLINVSIHPHTTYKHSQRAGKHFCVDEANAGQADKRNGLNPSSTMTLGQICYKASLKISAFLTYTNIKLIPRDLIKANEICTTCPFACFSCVMDAGSSRGKHRASTVLHGLLAAAIRIKELL